jgi:hypothetical protein
MKLIIGKKDELKILLTMHNASVNMVDLPSAVIPSHIVNV